MKVILRSIWYESPCVHLFGYVVPTFIFRDIYDNLVCLSFVYSRINKYSLFFETIFYLKFKFIIELLRIIEKGLEVNGKKTARPIRSEIFWTNKRSKIWKAQTLALSKWGQKFKVEIWKMKKEIKRFEVEIWKNGWI